MSTKHGGQGGAIVNVSSGSANLGNPGIGVLYGRKALLEAMPPWLGGGRGESMNVVDQSVPEEGTFSARGYRGGFKLFSELSLQV